MVADGALAWRAAFLEGLQPDPLYTVAEWADAHRVLSTRSSAEAGRWRTSRTPYLREVMEALSPSCPAREVVFQAGAQVGKTETGNNWIGFAMSYAPAPMLMVQPTLELARKVSRQRIDPLIEECDLLRSRVRDKRSRDAGNTVLQKQFPGGDLIMTGANSAVGLRAVPARYLFCDEIDAYVGDVEGEGDPLLLAKRAVRTYGSNAKVYLTSTPTFTGRSRIERAFLRSDRRYYHVPCPSCGELQRITWAQIKYEEKDASTAALECLFCRVRIPEHKKAWMLERGIWIAEDPTRSNQVRGYHLSALYSPLGWFSWQQSVEMFLEGRDHPDVLRVWANTVLGETWSDTTSPPPWEQIYNRREPYEQGRVPKGGLLLTAGVDVQKDRIECEVVAWGRARESWSIDYRVFLGLTESSVEPWEELRQYLGSSFPTATGQEMQIRLAAVDSSWAANTVYCWVRKQAPERIIAIKGKGEYAVLVGQPRAMDVTVDGRKLSRGVKLWTIGVDIAKSELYGDLRVAVPSAEDAAKSGYPPGFCHFPMSYADEYFKQLTAEVLRGTVHRGFRVYKWEKTYRNEALDCRVYARAAAAILGMDRYREEQWRALEAALGGPTRARPEPPKAPPARPGDDYWGRWEH